MWVCMRACLPVINQATDTTIYRSVWPLLGRNETLSWVCTANCMIFPSLLNMGLDFILHLLIANTTTCFGCGAAYLFFNSFHHVTATSEHNFGNKAVQESQMSAAPLTMSLGACSQHEDYLIEDRKVLRKEYEVMEKVGAGSSSLFLFLEEFLLWCFFRCSS